MNETVKELQILVSEKRAELAVLEAALDALRGVGGGDQEPAESRRPLRDLEGRTVRECCQTILREVGEAQYDDIADMAIQRGYSSGRSTEIGTIQRSFWDTLRRETDRFARCGRGRYRLRGE